MQLVMAEPISDPLLGSGRCQGNSPLLFKSSKYLQHILLGIEDFNGEAKGPEFSKFIISKAETGKTQTSKYVLWLTAI